MNKTETASKDAMLNGTMRDVAWHDEVTDADRKAMWKNHLAADVV